ncbi:MAG TPA: NAD(P)/FAD-dependent oxidoreductase [Rhodocyclaceae bacterium]|nr:NAD(P)/FAD-dependent oxidoreductase [Rhodocyclaceae bacterium]
MQPAGRFDALVVGGGPGGLTGALYLARFRRRVLVVDDGCSRAARIPRSHNMPGYPEGVIGADLVAAIRRQAERYGVEFAAGRVGALEHGPEGFAARWGEGGAGAQARVVLLATGASDIEPPVPYLSEAVRSGTLRYCPVCDGYEVIDRAVGVIADGPSGVREALYLRSFTPRLTVFAVSPEVCFGDDQRRQLAEAGIILAPEPVTSIRLWKGAVTVCHGDRETSCDSIYSALGMHIHSELALDAERDDDGYLLTDRHQKTSIDGLYAVGDVALGLNQISVAIGGAAVAAAAMHLALGCAWK